MAQLKRIPHQGGGVTWINVDNVAAVGDRPVQGKTGTVKVFCIGDTENEHFGFDYETAEQRTDILRALGIEEG